MIQKLNLDFEKAVRLLAQNIPVSKNDSRKPILFHDIRVGVYLYECEYSSDIILGGLLHDILEWSTLKEDVLRSEFGDAVTRIVLANTKIDYLQIHKNVLKTLCSDVSMPGRMHYL